MINGNYILVIAPEDYPGKKYRNKYCYEHQLVYWLNNSKLVPNGYLIHHKNENKHDNRIENLELLSVVYHSKLHSPIIKPITLNCSNCKKEFEIKRHFYNYKLKCGQKEFFCSRRCIGLYNYRSRNICR